MTTWVNFKWIIDFKIKIKILKNNFKKKIQVVESLKTLEKQAWTLGMHIESIEGKKNVYFKKKKFFFSNV